MKLIVSVKVRLPFPLNIICLNFLPYYMLFPQRAPIEGGCHSRTGGSQSRQYLCFTDVVRVVNLQGKLKERKKQTSELKFDFNIDSIGKLNICILLKLKGDCAIEVNATS